MWSFPLWLELRRWRNAGRTARLWWRDDDAQHCSAALDRLLQASLANGAPLTLAVVPNGSMTALAAQLWRYALVSAVQHGLDHVNRRTGPAAGEFPAHWSQGDVETALRLGRDRMNELPRRLPVFVPPWNDEHPQLGAALVACGYAGWSAHGTLSSQGDSLTRLDVHLDLLRWRGGARFRGRRRFLSGLAKELRRRRKAEMWTAPIGLLTHHLVHDEPAWRFLEAFVRWATQQPEMEWVAIGHLMDLDQAGFVGRRSHLHIGPVD